jgi:hypothetical protein
MRITSIPILLIALVSCTLHKLEVRLNGQPTQSMEARVAKEDGDRMVDLLLPGGAWAVSASEPGITPRIVVIDGRQHVRIELPTGSNDFFEANRTYSPGSGPRWETCGIPLHRNPELQQQVSEGFSLFLIQNG